MKRGTTGEAGAQQRGRASGAQEHGVCRLGFEKGERVVESSRAHAALVRRDRSQMVPVLSCGAAPLECEWSAVSRSNEQPRARRTRRSN